MVLIMSQQDDSSTDHVIQWLIHRGKPFCRIDLEDNFELAQLQIVDGEHVFSIFNKDKIVHLQNITAVWYRRGALNLPHRQVNGIEKEIVLQKLKAHLAAEIKSFREYFYHIMESKRHLVTFDRVF